MTIITLRILISQADDKNICSSGQFAQAYLKRNASSEESVAHSVIQNSNINKHLWTSF